MLLLGLLGLLVGFAPAPFPRRTKSKPLDGTWQRVSYEHGGYQIPNAALEMVISHDRVYFPRNSGGVLEAALVVGDTANPRTFDVKDVNPHNHWHYVGIYRVEGDTLIMCSTANDNGAGQRPKDFSGAGAHNHLEVFKRKKP
jgi:uncharacterized protein (TIGR03067 family)